MIPVAAWTLTFCGVTLAAIGAYFVLARPALLPEDARFIGTTAPALFTAAPGLARWLRRVFWVLGGYIAATGALVTYIANTGLRDGGAGALAILAAAWVVSAGWMAVVNVLLGSAFKWPLVALAGLWAAALVLASAAR